MELTGPLSKFIQMPVKATEQARITTKLIKQGLKTKSIEISKVRSIVQDLIGIDTTLFDLAIPEIFYFKHDVEASNIIIFIGIPNFISNAIPVQKQHCNLATALSHFAAH